jgi:hypothetical protein
LFEDGSSPQIPEKYPVFFDTPEMDEYSDYKKNQICCDLPHLVSLKGKLNKAHSNSEAIFSI